MQKMKAYVRTDTQNGTVELREMPIPEIDDHEVLVEVAAFGVRIHDRYFIPRDADFPYAIGTEAAGVVVKKGNNVTTQEIGDRVILTTTL